MVSWIYITEIFAQYVGTFLFCLNFFGGIMKIIIFSTRRPYRTKPCTTFMLVSAIAGCVQLINATIARILTTGYNIDLTRTSIVLCKVRQYSYSAAPGIAITCDCLSAIDQFLVTSRTVRLRQLSKMKLAYRVIVGVIFFWALNGIPFLIFTNIQSGICIIDNSVLQIYYIYVYFWCLYTTIPISILIVFGSLAYRNIRLLANVRQLHGVDRQLTLMVCTQIGLILIGVAPYTIFNIYLMSSANWNKDIEQKNKEYFIVNIISFIGTFEFGSSFYLFLAVSSRFRQQVKQYFCCCPRRINIVQPMNMNVRIVPLNHLPRI